MNQDSERSFDVDRNVEVSGAFENGWARGLSSIRIRPITQRLANLRNIRGIDD